MGQYLSPPSLDGIELKCAVVWYPSDNGRFFLSALRGQISELGAPWVWESGAAPVDEIVQLWREAEELTDRDFFRLNCEDVPLVTGDEAVEVNVSVDCGCCGAPSYSPGPEAAPVTYSDLPPEGGVDDGGNMGFSSRSTYEAYKCKAARKLAEDAYQTLLNMSTFGGAIGALGGVLGAGLVTTSALSPLVVGLMAAGLSAPLAITLLLALFASMLLFGGAVWAYFEAVADGVGENLDLLTCELYNATTAEGAKQALAEFMSNRLAEVVYNSSEDEGFFTSKFLDLIEILIPTKSLELLFEAVDYVVNLAQPPFDCSLCGAPEVPAGYHLVAATPSVDNTWVSSSTAPSASVAGGVVTASATSSATGSNHYLDVTLTLDDSGLDAAEKVVGFIYEFEAVSNIATNGGRVLLPHPDGSSPLWDGAITNRAAGLWANLSSEGHGAFTPWGGSKYVGVATNADSCKPIPRRVRLGAYNAAAGSYSFRLKSFYWIVATGAACP